MRYITTTDTNITFTDVDGKVKIVPKNKVYTHFNVDTVTFLLIERYDNEGICLFTTKASDLQINGETYTYQELLDGEGISDLFSPTGLSFEVVEELPQSGEEGTIYLVPNDHDTYTEYIWIAEEEKWETIGDSDIDLSNYYTKSQVDALIPTNVSDLTNDTGYITQTTADSTYATQTVVNQEIAARIQGDADINTALQAKADKTDTYTKTQVDTALADKANSADLATVATSGDYDDLSNKPTIPAAQVNADWNASSGVAQILNKPTNVSAFTNDAGYLTQHQSLDNYYTKSEVDTELADKQDTLTAGTGIDITNNVISATGGTQVQSDWNQSDSSAVDYIKNKPTIPDTSDFVTKAEYNPKEVAIANALTDLNENKADKTQLSSKQDTLVSGTNIKTINNQSLLGSGDITIQGGGMTMQEYYEDIDTNIYRDYTYIETEIGSYTNNFILVPFDYETGTIVTGGQVIEEYDYGTISFLIDEIDSGSYTIEVDGGQSILMSDITVDGSQYLIEFDWEDSEEQTQTASVQVVSDQVVVTKFPDDCYLRFIPNNSIVGWTDLEDNYYTKSEIDAMIGNINTILASI